MDVWRSSEAPPGSTGGATLAVFKVPAPTPPNCASREKQAALAAEEARRKAAAAASAAKFRADVAGQLGEKEAARLAELQGKRAELVALMADLEVGGWGWSWGLGRAMGGSAGRPPPLLLLLLGACNSAFHI